MIAYFDTSAVIPLIVDEPTSDTCARVWDTATRVVSVRLLYPEARSALARAARLDRITVVQLRAAVGLLDSLIDEIDHIEVTASLAHTAGELAHAHTLRGYDAVHLAAAAAADDGDLVLVTGDSHLAVVARSVGLPVAGSA